MLQIKSLFYRQELHWQNCTATERQFIISGVKRKSAEQRDKSLERNRFSDSVTLPSAEEIIFRLRQAKDDLFFLDSFYKLIAQYSGRTFSYRGLVSAIIMSVDEFQKIPLDPRYTRMIVRYIPTFISVLIDDDELTQKALHFYEEINQEQKRLEAQKE